MFRKGLLIGTTLLVLASCTATKNETPEEVLTLNQKAIIEKIEKYSYPISIGEIETNADIAINSEDGNASIKLDYNFDFDNDKKEANGDIKGSMEISSKEMSGSGLLDLSILSKDDVAYFRLNNLNINIPGEQSVEMIKMMALGYVGKWIAIDLGSKELNLSASLLNLDKVLAVYKKYPILKSVKENEDKDFYNYDVSINEDNLVKIYKEIALLDDKEYTEEDISTMKEELSKIKFSGNLKVGIKNKEYFVFVGTIDDIKMEITNDKNIFKMNISGDGGEAVIDFKKSSSGIVGDIIVSEDGKEQFRSNLEIRFSSSSFDITGDIISEGIEAIIDVKTKFKAKDSIEVTIPKEFIKLEELMQGLIGGMMGAPVVPGKPLDQPFGATPGVEFGDINNEINVDMDDLEMEEAMDSDEVKEAMDEIESMSDLEGLEELLK